jgi:thiamine biosynthesis lipoprotein
MTTDALSTTIFVLGAIKGIALIETLNNIDAIIIDNQGKVHYSSGLQEPPSND